MFRWLTERRRRKLVRTPFPAAWEELLRRNITHYGMLEESERAHLRSLVQVFIAEKNWEGAGGLEITDEIRVTIAAYACLLLLGLSHDYYRNVAGVLALTLIPEG